MRTIACVNQKGGSGKTTTAVNLAAALGERGRRVLLIDLDPQASASSWLGAADAGRGMLDMFAGEADALSLVRESSAPGVEIIPSSAWLVGVEKALAGEVGAETILRAKLAALPERWDVILLDCAPTLGILTVNALAAAREVLVPVEAHVMALTGLAQLLQTISIVRERLNPELEVAGIVACRVDARTRHSQEIVTQLRERFGSQVYKTPIRENVRLAECPSFAQPITQYESRSAGAQDYRALAEEVEAQSQQTSPKPRAKAKPSTASTSKPSPKIATSSRKK
jgi:chromosome partitioning protein